MTSRVHSNEPNITFRRKSAASEAMAGTTMAGAIMGGTIGAFTGGPLVTVAGMAIGALAARAITRYVHDESKAPTNGETPAR